MGEWGIVGSSITLISTPAAIYLSDDQLTRTYTIQNGDTTQTPARLSYTEGVGFTLLLVPEPQTPLLALLSLTLLLRRRRRK